MCQPKDKGGLEVRDIRMVNVSLLAKWRWRLLNGENMLWKEVLIAKYGNNIGELVHGLGDVMTSISPRWLKDIMNIEVMEVGSMTKWSEE